MAGQSQFPVIKEEAGGFNMSQLVKSFSVFQNSVQELTSELEGKKIENAFLKEKLKTGGLEKSRLEKENKEFKEMASRLTKERDEMSKKLKESEVDQKKFIEMRKKNCELECDKFRAESDKVRADTDLEVYRRRFKELEGRVLCLEKDLEMLTESEKNVEEAVGMDIEEKDAIVNLATAAPGRQNFAKSEVLSDYGSSDRKRTEDKVVILVSDDEPDPSDD